MRIRAYLPIPSRRQFQQRRGVQAILRTQRARLSSLLLAFRMSDDYPTARDGVFA